MRYIQIILLVFVMYGCKNNKAETRATVDTIAIFHQKIIDSVHAKALPNVVVDSTHYFEFNGYDSINGGYRVEYTHLTPEKGWSKFYNYYPKTNTVIDGITFDTIK